MKKVTLWLLVLAITIGMIATLSFTGCKGESTAETTAAAETTVAAETTAAAAETTAAAGEKPFAGTTINVVNLEGWAVTKPLWDHIGEFEEATGIKVVVNEIPFAEIKTKQVLEGESQTGAYDVWQTYDTAMPLMYKYVLPLDDLIARDYNGLDTWISERYSTISECSFENKWFFNPIMGGIQIGFYRKALFEDPANMEAFKAKYGYDIPTPNENGVIVFETTDQILDLAKFFTKDDMYGLTIPGKGNHGACIWYLQMFDAGFNYVDQEVQPLWPANKDKVLEIAKWDQDLIQTYKVCPEGAVSWEMPEMIEQYFAGKSAMVVSWLHDFWKDSQSEEIKANIGETGTFLFPSRGTSQGGYIGYWGWGISKDSKNSEAAWEFVKWANSDEVQTYMLQEGGGSFQPAKISLAEWGAENGLIPPATVEGGKTCVLPYPFYDVMDQIWKLTEPLHEELLSGAITPQQFYDSHVEQIDAILKESGHLK